MASGLLITLGLIAAYIVLLFWLARSGRMEKWNLSLMLGFVLMVRTQKGKKTLDILAKPKRLWNIFGDLGIVTTLIGMAAMTFFFLWSLTIVLRPDSGVRALGASEILVIPGVNPFVPLWYGIIALIVTLVVHEGGHGVLARANNMRVKSLGLLFAVVPIGAFVEPDESELMASSRRNRLRVFGAGPMVNLVFAFAALSLCGVMFAAAMPVDGVPISSVTDGAPAHIAGIEGAMVLVSADSMVMNDYTDFVDFMASKSPGDQATFGTRDDGAYDVTLSRRWDHMSPEEQQSLVDNPGRQQELEGALNDAFLGVRSFDPVSGQKLLTEPYSTFESGGRSIPNLLVLFGLPLGEIQGQPYLSVYMPEFYESPWGGDWFMRGTILMFWIFWINLMVGLTNILPMLPLDGGHIFRDAVGAVMQKIRPRMDAQHRDRIVGRTAGFVSIVILVAFLLYIIGPRL